MSGMYRIRLQQFEGPLDLLLFFIRRDELDVYDIPIASITDEFLEYVRILEEVDLDGVGDFSDPAQLAEMMIEAGKVDECVSTQLLRFALGRYELADEDKNFAKRITQDATGEGGLQMRKLLVEMVASDAFRHRREEVVE